MLLGQNGCSGGECLFTDRMGVWGENVCSRIKWVFGGRMCVFGGCVLRNRMYLRIAV